MSSTIEDVIIRLKNVLYTEDCTAYKETIAEVLRQIDTPNKMFIEWQVADVIMHGAQRKLKVSLKEAQDVLCSMDRRHDCTLGITWDTIDAHLSDRDLPELLIFDEHFETQPVERFHEDTENNMLETYGKQLDFVLDFIQRDPNNIKHLFTIVEADNGQLYCIPGYHIVNRFGYVITKEAWEDPEAEYAWDQ